MGVVYVPLQTLITVITAFGSARNFPTYQQPVTFLLVRRTHPWGNIAKGKTLGLGLGQSPSPAHPLVGALGKGVHLPPGLSAHLHSRRHRHAELPLPPEGPSCSWVPDILGGCRRAW